MENIKITDLEVFAHHGVLADETEHGQGFLVSVDILANLDEAIREDDVEKTVDYAKLCHMINDFLTTNTFKLIETAADRLAVAILGLYKYKIGRVQVEIKKPSAPVGLRFGNISAVVERHWHTAYISVGSNMGDREGFISSAIDGFIFSEDCVLTKASSVIETKPYGKVAKQPDFLNCCLEIKTLLPPEKLLEKLLSLETAMGRKRDVDKGERTLDLDLILYDDVVLDTKHLTVPHADMHNRRFVLEPLCEIAPCAVHPLFNKTARELLDNLK